MATGAGSDDISQSQQEWRAVRAELGQRRHQLAVAAEALYPDVRRVGETGLLCRPNWLPDAPIDLGDVQLRWVDELPVPPITSSSAESAAARPLSDTGERFATYADAIGELNRPALFENRPIYRLLDADLEPASGWLDLTSGRYFDAISLGEALAHEFAAVTRVHGQLTDMRQLPLRAAIGDPCDLSRRPASVAITTLTLRRTTSGDATFLLHWRDPAKVTHAAGLYQVMPVGIFQPADENPASMHHDLNLWESMVREFSEELLGESEDYSRLGSPIQYEQWDFYHRLTGARQAGSLRVSFLGVGVDPLTLVADILAVAVFDAGRGHSRWAAGGAAAHELMDHRRACRGRVAGRDAHLLARARWDAGGVRDDVRGSVIEHLRIPQMPGYVRRDSASRHPSSSHGEKFSSRCNLSGVVSPANSASIHSAPDLAHDQGLSAGPSLLPAGSWLIRPTAAQAPTANLGRPGL